MSDLLTEATVSLDLARRISARSEAEARKLGKPMGIAVVDRAGHVILATRMDGASPVALRLAIDKAFTAAAFNAPTDAWSEVTQPGAADWGLTSALGGRIVILAGGLPIRVDGRLVGALGVSGAAPSVDLACAQAGLTVFTDQQPIQYPGASMSLAQQKVVVLAYPQYQELDFWYPVLRGREEGATVHIIGNIVGEAAESILGYPVIPDTEDVDPTQIALIVAPGVAAGASPKATAGQLALVAAVHAAGGLVAAVGNGAEVTDAALPGQSERIIRAAGTDDLAPFFGTIRSTLTQE
ncbi:hypothetical protein Acor_68520 [Acrocarpospora corrugata]|uniref:DJ-1/PfpI domain-containing protein n=1 Tax=Acrocarpospora corrugata TaxID=35763 RepID=A0A5M3W7I9_9ACTN|nr:heme-binding protein [Acrocarpospora corrugata]GES04784.1 hypothetical protein Acor_68520 [Acrocarpospora corrugata]